MFLLIDVNLMEICLFIYSDDLCIETYGFRQNHIWMGKRIGPPTDKEQKPPVNFQPLSCHLLFSRRRRRGPPETRSRRIRTGWRERDPPCWWQRGPWPWARRQGPWIWWSCPFHGGNFSSTGCPGQRRHQEMPVHRECLLPPKMSTPSSWMKKL